MTRRKLGLLMERSGQFQPAYGLDRLVGEFAAGDMGEAYLLHERDIPRRDGVPYVLDQGSTSSCVANAFAQALHMAEMRAGLQFVDVSRLYMYWHARKEHNGQWFDSGTYLRTCASGLRRFGACDSERWPWATRFTRVNRRPSWNAMRFAHPRRGGEYIAIHETGADRIRAVQVALRAGHDVAFGTRVGKSFLPNRGPAHIEPPPITEDIAGNHAMLIIGWAHRSGQLYFRVVNSWGRNWRDGGLCWLRADYIAAAYTRDLHVIHGWDRLRNLEVA